MATLLVYVIPIVFIFFFLIWWKKMCVWDYSNYNFPTLGHGILIFLLSFIPIFGLIEALILIIVYIVNRTNGDLELKENNFNKKFFDVGK